MSFANKSLKPIVEGHQGSWILCILGVQLVTEADTWTGGQLLCTETLKDVILQRGGNQKTQSGELQKAERIDLKEALFCQHHVKQTFFEKCKGKRSGEPLLTGVIPIQLQSSRRTPETSYIPN